jgi:thioesterase domain-containing protein
VVDLQPTGANCPFFLVHGIGGEVLSLRALAHCLAPQQPLYGLRAKGSDSAEEPLGDVESMAACYIDAMKTIAARGPYLIGGYSSGGTVALEMAQQLQSRGDRVALVVLIDADAPAGPAPRDARVWLEYLRNLATWSIDDDFFRSGLSNAVDRIRSKGRVWRARLTQSLMRRDIAVDIRDALGVWKFPGEHRKFLEVHSRALASYKPRPYDGPMAILRARTAPLSEWRSPDLGWGAIARGGLAIQTIRGAHDNILTEPRVQVLAAKLTACLNAAVP